MNKALLTMVLGAAALTAGAQVVEVQSIEKVPVKAELRINIPQISPDGTFAVVSNLATSSLDRVDLQTGAVTPVVDNGSALQMAFSPDGSTIVYKKSVTRPDRRRFYSLESYELNTGYARTLVQPARRSTNFSISSRGVLSYKYEGRLSARSLKDQTIPVDPFAIVGIYHGHLEVTYANGETVYLDPQGKGSYLWPSLSPDGTKIVYYLSGRGCFICNLDGTGVKALGYIHAPRWIDNKTLVGMQDYDDGATLLSSSIVAADLEGNIQTLTDETIYGFNPSVSADGKKITFSTFEGELYVINLK